MRGMIIIYFFCIIQNICAQKDVTYFLKHASLYDFVASCDSNEYDALRKLYEYDLPDICPDTLMWYNENHLYPYRPASYIYDHQGYVSLKMKAYSWIIRIFKKEYEICYNSVYDFDCWDYRVKKAEDYENMKTRQLEKQKQCKREKIKKELRDWFSSLNKYGLDSLRQLHYQPISPKHYHIRASWIMNPEYISSDFKTEADSCKWNTKDTCENQGVEYYLRHKTILDFVTSCDSNEYVALRKLYEYNLSNNCSDTLMWYSNREIPTFNEKEAKRTSHMYASLKLKSYAWISRIFWRDYYEDCEYYYDFGFFDYMSCDKSDEICCLNENSLEENDNLKRMIDNWFISLNKRGLTALRLHYKSPIFFCKYSIFTKSF